MRTILKAVLLAGLASTGWCGNETDPLGVLVEQLNDSDPTVSTDAVRRIASLKPVPAVVVPLLAHRLHLPEYGHIAERNLVIIEAFDRFGPDAKAAVPRLIAWCDANGPNTWKPAIDALRRICPEHARIVDAIGRDGKLLRAVLLLLTELDPETDCAFKLLKEGLGHESPAIRLASCRAMNSFREQAKDSEAELIGLIGDDDARVRASAISLVAKFVDVPASQPQNPDPFSAGPLRRRWEPRPAAIPTIRTALADEVLPVRVTAAHALRNTEPANQKLAVPVLIEGLQHRDTRDLAIAGLKAIGALGVDATPALRDTILAATEDWRHTWTKHAAARALRRVADADTAVLIYREALERNSVYRGSIYSCLGSCGSNPEAIDILIDAATGPRLDPQNKADSRDYAIRALGRLRPPATRATKALVRIAKGDNLEFRWTAIDALKAIGIQDDRVRPALVDLVRLPDRDGQHRNKAASVLAELGLDERTVRRLRRLLKHEDPSVRRIAVELLGEAGDRGTPAIPVLIELLDDEEASVGQSAMVALSKLGVAAECAVPALAERMIHHDGYWHDSPARALSEMGPAAIPTLIELMQRDDNQRAQWGADEALKHMGPSAAPAVPALIKLLNSKNLTARYHAINVLGAIGPGAAPAVPKLAAMRRREFQDSSDELRFPLWHLQRALIGIGEPSVNAFVDDLESDHPQRRLAAIRALHAIGPDARAAVSCLTPLLANEDQRTRFSAAEALCAIGDKRGASMPVLREMFARREESSQLGAIRLMPAVADADKSGWIRESLRRSLGNPSEYIRFAAARALVDMEGEDAAAVLPVLTQMMEHPSVERSREGATLVTRVLGRESNSP